MGMPAARVTDMHTCPCLGVPYHMWADQSFPRAQRIAREWPSYAFGSDNFADFDQVPLETEQALQRRGSDTFSLNLVLRTQEALGK